MTNYAEPALTPNSMTVIELTREALAELASAAADAVSTVHVMLEVEPDGAHYFKVKCDNYSWSPPLEGATALVERLYDEPVAP